MLDFIFDSKKPDDQPPAEQTKPNSWWQFGKENVLPPPIPEKAPSTGLFGSPAVEPAPAAAPAAAAAAGGRRRRRK